MNSTFLIGSYAIFVLASLYLLVTARFQHLVYSGVILLIFGIVLGSLFKILHLPGADELLLIGLTGMVIGAGLLIWKSVRNKQDQFILNKLVAGGLILAQVAIAIFWPELSDRTALLNYPVTAFMATVVINKQYEHQGERNLLLLFTLQGFFYILIEVMQMF